MTIVLKKKNDVYLEAIEGERSELKMLSDWFTFEVEGAKFSPQYRNKFWDGKIRLFSTKDMTIYAGLAHEIIKFSKQMDVDVEFEGTQYDFPGREQPLDDAFAEGFLDALDPHSNGKKITMREYQIDAFKTALRKQRCLLLSPTASGKSLIIYALIRWWLEVHNRKVLIIVPSVSLVTQMISDFSDYSNGKWNDCYGITSGVGKDFDQRVCVSTWQSIYKMPASWFAQFESVIVDEVHTAQASSIQTIMKKLIVCPDRIGLTGTLKDSKTHELALKGLFGPVKKVISTKELMDNDQIAKMKVQLLQFDYDAVDRKTASKLDYPGEIDFITKHEKRNKIIAKMASTLPGNTLVVFQRIEHGKLLFEALDTEKQTYYVAGETHKEVREATRQLAEDNDVVIIASLGVFSTGISIKNLHNLVFAHPTKSKIKVLQSIGRVLRKHDDKAQATVFDIIDDLKNGQRQNFALRHANERFKQYTEEQFEYKISTIKL